MLFALLFLSASQLASPHPAPDEFLQWESPHVHPLELTPDGKRLLAVNTADHRLEVFALGADGPKLAGSVPVGLEPVSVRARDAHEAWVVNRISDSVSVVDLDALQVRATLTTEDEPADVVFAGSPLRAYVSCERTGALLVLDPAAPEAAPGRLALEGNMPRALAVAPDGTRVYVAFFTSGNRTTILGGGSEFNLDFPPNVVGDRTGPHGGHNPPPSTPGRAGFTPALARETPPPPRVGLIVRQDEEGRWRDEVGGDWTMLVSGPQAARSGRIPGWQLVDHDVAVVDTRDGRTRYVSGLMNAVMSLAPVGGAGELLVLGTDATNERRFEPNLRGRFVRVLAARLAADGEARARFDLNPHLDYGTASLAPEARRRALADPRGLVWDARRARAYASGMGSDCVLELGPDGTRSAAAPIAVGAGPTGLALDPQRARLYVLCRFEGALSVVDTEAGRELVRVPFHDATPRAVRAGRALLYDAHATSGLGQAACASCHLDARVDHLAWDLGDPSGTLAPLGAANQAADNPLLKEDPALKRGAFEPFHPMKGPMTTQTLQAIIGTEPLHWRGDRAGLEDFAGAFVSLLGGDAPPAPAALQELEDFLATILLPPNPYRTLENELPQRLALAGHVGGGRFGPAGQPLPDGDARRGLELFRSAHLDNGRVNCVNCHTLPTGLGPDRRLVDGRYVEIAPGPRGERHHMLVSMDGSTNAVLKVPQLRTLYTKVGCELGLGRSLRGFGFLHDGSVDSLARFLGEPQFTLTSDQDTADLVAFLLCFSGSDLPAGAATKPEEPPGSPSRDAHAAVGRQRTLRTPREAATLAPLLALARSGRVGLVAHGRRDGRARGFALADDGRFQSARAAEQLTTDELLSGASSTTPLTFTVVPRGFERRLALDRDQDGAFDRDELDAGSRPDDATNRPPR